jgi:hypothetical protein
LGTRHVVADTAKKKVENTNGYEKRATKALADKIRLAFEQNANEETVGNGVVFVVEDVLSISRESVINL